MMKLFSAIYYTTIFVQLFFSMGINTIRYCVAQNNVVKQTDQALVDSQSNQVMLTVIANIETVLETVTILLNRVVALRDHNAFQYGMTAADHELIFIVLGSNSNEIKTLGTTMYLILDDGTAFGSYAQYGYSGVAYREPGNSGYSILDIQESDPNYKYYIACVNYTNGEQMNCTMQWNTTYVECINNCEPIPCNTSKTDDENSNITHMCRNYEIKVAEENNTFGYVPFSYYCVNQYLQPEQRPGYVALSYDVEGKVNSFGDCIYTDNHTIVNRTLRGDYAFCGPNKTCDTTYQGGFYGFDYDPRLDPEYIQTKEAQGPTWTAPTVSGYSSLSVSYNLPIYKQPKLNDTMMEGLLFEGVIGMSFDTYPIAEFLKTIQYGNTGQRVFIVENVEPYNLVGSSLQQFTYNTTMDGCEYCGKLTFDGVLKWVLYSNNSELCPYLDGSIPFNFTDFIFNCTAIRASIDEFFDTVSRRAFQRYVETSFVSTEKGIYFKEDDNALGTQAYVAYSRLYTKQNLKWHVFVVSQVDRSSTDALLKGNPMFTVICIVATIGFLTCATMFYWFYQRRTEKAVIHSDWRFTCTFIVGCAFINCSSYTLLGDNTNPLCMLRMWSFNGLFVCALSPLFVKVWRMAKLLNASAGFQRTTVTNFQACLYTLPLVILELTFLMIVSIVDPPHATEELGVGDGIGYQVVQCSQTNSVFFYLQTIFHGSLVLVGCVLAYLTRDLDPKYGEAKQLAFSMYNIAFTGLTTILIMTLVELDQVSKIVIQTISVLWGSCFCSLAFVLPRLLQVQKDLKRGSKKSSGASAYSLSSSWNIMSRLHNESTISVADLDAKPNDGETYSKFVGTQMESVIEPLSLANSDKDGHHDALKTVPELDPKEPIGLSDNLEGRTSESDGTFKNEPQNNL